MALTLKRRHLETIVYLLPDGRRITATVVSPDTVKISSEAPSDVQILRGELADETGSFSRSQHRFLPVESLEDSE